MGEDERISPMDALKAVTVYGAYQYFEEKEKGSIRPRNLQDDAFCRQKALKRLAMAMEIFQTLVFQTSLAQVRKGAGYIMEFLAVGIAFANHTYLKATQTYMIEELEKMDALPENFTSLCRSVLAAENTEEIKCLSYEMLVATRTFFEKGAPAAQNKAPVPASPRQWIL